jgi:lipopolysaccharide transport system ATP-binding protein
MIEVNGVWKAYHNHAQLGIKERLAGKRLPAEGRFSRNWALQDISFTVDSGRSLGIVGHNGTGKSTLLSLVLGTIKEDRGTINRKGHIGAMLELGSGCHPDLTGRENIFLNGSILGLRIAEIKQKFDSIVDFSELGPAIDWPMRTYSSGMSARLAFSVLAHAHRDVLLIDEILAVGDASFQSKCSAYLRDYTAQGGTLVVVSHNLQTLQELCVDGIWLHEGKLVEHGSIAVAVQRYRQSVVSPCEGDAT